MLDLGLSVEFASLVGLTPVIPATWNAADKSGMTLSNGNLTATVSGGSPGGVRATKAISGKVYAEFLILNNAGDFMVGVTEAGTSLASWLYNGAGTHSVMWYTGVNSVYFGGGGGAAQPTGVPGPGVGYVLGLAADQPNNKLWVASNNTWSGDPVAGTGGFSLAGTSGALFFAMQGDASESLTADFGATTYVYTPPTGFTGL